MLGHAIHTFASDVYMLGAMIWECCTHIWKLDDHGSVHGGGCFLLKFEEGFGLQGIDLARTHVTRKRGGKVSHGLDDVAVKMEEDGASPSLVNAVLRLLCGSLQQDINARPSMHQMHLELRRLSAEAAQN
eukprot:TRINITY_DN12055_c0_g1_i6.p1 TRINITY_DN12055_c0_g1~~TRINITY_DN12055_c0_g1_i6.p1  ORF type:complete len:130 (-),score=31.97 TRINITY_DN12055_c0_g1_i6:264-653(-)